MPLYGSESDSKGLTCQLAVVTLPRYCSSFVLVRGLLQRHHGRLGQVIRPIGGLARPATGELTACDLLKPEYVSTSVDSVMRVTQLSIAAGQRPVDHAISRWSEDSELQTLRDSDCVCIARQQNRPARENDPGSAARQLENSIAEDTPVSG